MPSLIVANSDGSTNAKSQVPDISETSWGDVMAMKLTIAAVERARMVRLRKLQRLINADLNALASHVGDSGDLPPTAEQWADLWHNLEAASATLQRLTKARAAAEQNAMAERRRLRDRGSGADKKHAL